MRKPSSGLKILLVHPVPLVCSQPAAENVRVLISASCQVVDDSGWCVEAEGMNWIGLLGFILLTELTFIRPKRNLGRKRVCFLVQRGFVRELLDSYMFSKPLFWLVSVIGCFWYFCYSPMLKP